jgi:formate hydrogenlyase subunit 3/multisubunit Na+/H+ antiporter MnhD subunit
MFTLLAVGLNLCVGVAFILSKKKYIEELDELQRRVYLNALAITLGVALIIGVPFSVMSAYHVIPFKGDISNLIMLMGLTFLVSLFYGLWRYR